MPDNEHDRSRWIKHGSGGILPKNLVVRRKVGHTGHENSVTVRDAINPEIKQGRRKVSHQCLFSDCLILVSEFKHRQLRVRASPVNLRATAEGIFPKIDEKYLQRGIDRAAERPVSLAALKYARMSFA